MELRKLCLLVGGQKGGTGKTSTAMHLAVMRRALGRNVLILDADEQQTITKWVLRRASIESVAARVPCLSAFDPETFDMTAEVPRLLESYDDIVIDSSGHRSTQFVSALTVANRLITPIRPAQFDADTMPEVDRIVGIAKTANHSLDAMWFAYGGPAGIPGQKQIAAVRNDLAGIQNIAPAKSFVSLRFALHAQCNIGYSLFDLPSSESRTNAIAEFTNLFHEAWDTGVEYQQSQKKR